MSFSNITLVVVCLICDSCRYVSLAEVFKGVAVVELIFVSFDTYVFGMSFS